MSSVYKPEQCWLCPENFATRRDLKNHLGNSLHDVLKVVCPFCFEQEKTCRRIHDLKKHVESDHKSRFKRLSSSFFSENNGFWLAMKPDDYRRIITPSRRDTVEAQEARLEVHQLLTMNKALSRGKTEWFEGWRRVKEDKWQHASEGEFQPSYSPERPISVETLEVHLVSGNIYLDVKCGTDFWRAHLHDRVLKDLKTRDSLLRKMTTLPEDGIKVPEDARVEKLHQAEELTKVGLLARTLNINHSFFKCVTRMIHPITDLGQSASIPPPSVEEELKAYEASLFFLSTNHTTATTSSKPVTLSARLDPIPSISNETIPVYTPSSLGRAVTNTLEAQQPQNPSQSVVTAVSTSATSQTAIISSSTSSTGSGNLRRVSFENQYEDISDEELGTTMKSRAKQLLTMGCMPLFPPARREWKNGQIKLTDSIVWPPNNHEQLTPDQKLLVLEHTGMTLEMMASPSNIPHRSALLEKFNFLALPGTSLIVPSETDKVATKGRFYNHETLRQIALGELHDELFLQMMERAFPLRDRSVDKYIKLCKYIPLRLGMENQS